MKIFYGEERYLIDLAIAKEAKQLLVGQKFMTFDETDPTQDIIWELSNVSLFAKDKNIIIKNHPIITNLQESEFFLTEVEKLLAQANIIFVLESNYLPNTNLVKMIKSKGLVFNFPRQSIQKKSKIIRDYVQASGGSIANRAIMNLLAATPDNLVVIMQEIKKLLAEAKIITEKMINQSVAKYLKEDFFALSNAIINQDEYQIIQSYKQKIDNGISPMVLINQISRVFILAKKIYHLRQNHHSPHEIASLLNIHIFRVTKISDLIHKLSEKEINQFILDLAALEQNIKKGNINEHLGLDYYILQLIK